MALTAEIHIESAKPLSGDGPKQCVVIVDYENVRGSIRDARDNKFTCSGIKTLLELFHLTPRVLHVVAL